MISFMLIGCLSEYLAEIGYDSSDGPGESRLVLTEVMAQTHRDEDVQGHGRTETHREHILQHTKGISTAVHA